MGKISSQFLTKLTIDAISSKEWRSIPSVVSEAIKFKYPEKSDIEISDIVSDHCAYITSMLLDKSKSSLEEGSFCNFEIDEPEEYIKLKYDSTAHILEKLKKICPFEFERVCEKLLEKFGCESQPKPKTRDGGIDFVSIGLDIFPAGIVCPKNCKATIIGQAKRYNDSLVAEKALREFVGASLVKRHDLRLTETLSPLTPVILAFWTTSDFDPSGRKFAQRAGVWLMDGPTIATYLKFWDLEEWVMALTEVSTAAVSEVGS